MVQQHLHVAAFRASVESFDWTRIYTRCIASARSHLGRSLQIWRHFGRACSLSCVLDARKSTVSASLAGAHSRPGADAVLCPSAPRALHAAITFNGFIPVTIHCAAFSLLLRCFAGSLSPLCWPSASLPPLPRLALLSAVCPLHLRHKAPTPLPLCPPQAHLPLSPLPLAMLPCPPRRKRKPSLRSPTSVLL